MNQMCIRDRDEDRVEELLDDAKMDIQDLPDPTIGKLELRDYGYTAEDLSLIHIYQKGKEESRRYLTKTRLSVVLVFADGRYTERIKKDCLLMGQSVFMIEVSKEVKEMCIRDRPRNLRICL